MTCTSNLRRLNGRFFTLVFFLSLWPSQAVENKPVRHPVETSDPRLSKSIARHNSAEHPVETLKSLVQKLPPAPEGVSNLFFDDFFKSPVGRLGLEINPKLTELNGRKVRVLGFMVKQTRPTPWTLMLAPMPLICNEVEFGLADDLPASTLRVLLPKSHQPITPFTPGLLLLTGRIEVGDREEADGRHSLVRLQLDPLPSRTSVQTNVDKSDSAPAKEAAPKISALDLIPR